MCTVRRTKPIKVFKNVLHTWLHRKQFLGNKCRRSFYIHFIYFSYTFADFPLPFLPPHFLFSFLRDSFLYVLMICNRVGNNPFFKTNFLFLKNFLFFILL